MSVNRLQPECIRCLVSKQLNACPENTPPEKQLEYMQRVLRLVADARRDVGVPAISRDIKNLKRELFGVQEDFTEIKRYFNALMLSKEAELQKRADDADDPLTQALQYAFVGNYIDFGGAMHKVQEDELDRLLHDAPTFALNEAVCEHLRGELLTAKRIVYLTDNCGEIVTDKVLLRVIRRMNPDAELIAMVRGMDVLNDATRVDAEQVRLSDVARVMDNGSDVAGTWLEDISEEAKSTLEGADLILAKGQANFETLRGCGMNVFYLFMCKCKMFAEKFQKNLFEGILINDKAVMEN